MSTKQPQEVNFAIPQHHQSQHQRLKNIEAVQEKGIIKVSKNVCMLSVNKYKLTRVGIADN